MSDEVKAKFADYCQHVDWKRNAQLHQEAKERVQQQTLKVRSLYETDVHLRELYNTVADT